MPFQFDIEKDPFYREGVEIGVEIGIEKGIEKGIRKALLRGKLSIEEIAEDFEVSLDFVLEIKKKLGL